MKSDIYVKVTGLGTIAVKDTRDGKDELFTFPLPNLLHFREAYFSMEQQK
ncbi:unnamed protein product [marine sediment metagenome]|uniref:Uncharacterized protein n=1 Tax=marine sediment metagenome TaxID=412755 RepID=X1DXM5_9ZZZZ